MGETMILVKNREYLLRYDREDGEMAGAFRFWVWLDGGWQPTWKVERSVPFDVVPMDGDDRVYAVPMPAVGGVKQLKVAFADGEPVTGTVRLDYIWAGRLP